MNLLHAIAPSLATRLLLGNLRRHVWGATPEAVEAVLDDVATMHPVATSLQPSATMADEWEAYKEVAKKGYRTKGRRAHVAMRGLMIAGGPAWLSLYFAMAEHIIAAIRAANVDPEIDDVVIDVDSPGGSVLGVEAIRETIKGSKKPVTAHVLSMCASAAYYAVTPAARIVARPGAVVGSLGVFAVITDSSKQAESEGRKVHVIKAGDLKAIGTPGTPVTSEHLAYLRKRVDGFAADFKAAIMDGRGFDDAKAESLMTGADWGAREALELGLIDAIEDMDTKTPGAAAPATITRTAEGGDPLNDSARGEAVAAEETDMTMTKDEADALRAKAAAAEAEATRLAAENAVFAASAAQVEKNEKAAIVAAAEAEGRVVPAMREQIDAYAAIVKPDALRAFVAKLPVQTRTTTTGNGVDANTATAASTHAAPPANANEAALFNMLGVTSKDVETYGDVIACSFDGTMTKADGTVRKAVI